MLKFDNITKENFDLCFSSIVTVVKDIIDNHTPYRRLIRKQQKLQNIFWITNGIQTSIKHKKRMFKTHHLSNDQTKIKYSSTTKNIILQKLLQQIKKIKNFKKMYYDTKLKENVGNPQKMWKILRTLLSQDKDPL